MPDGTHAGTGRGYTWLGLPGTNGSPGLPLPRPYIYIYMLLGFHGVLDDLDPRDMPDIIYVSTKS